MTVLARHLTAVALVLSFLQGCEAFSSTNFAPKSTYSDVFIDKPLTTNSLFSKGYNKKKSLHTLSLNHDINAKATCQGSENDGLCTMKLSFSILTGCRRLSFLLLSISFVNTFFSVVLKASNA